MDDLLVVVDAFEKVFARLMPIYYFYNYQ